MATAPLRLAPAPIRQGGSGPVWTAHLPGGGHGTAAAGASRRDATDRAGAQVLDAAHRCVDALVRTALLGDDGAPTWATRAPGPDGRPLPPVAGRRSLRSGDAGIAWALTHLGVALERPDARELGTSAATVLSRTRPVASDHPTGLFAGEAGVDLLVRPAGPATPGWSGVGDLADGLAGILLALARTRRHARHAAAIVGELRRHVTVDRRGCGRSGSTSDRGAAGLSHGLAHGASGVAWALVEAAAAWPELAEQAVGLAQDVLAREAPSPDVAHGEGDGIVSAPWCLGAAGSGAVRLRVLQLAGAGLDPPWSAEATRAEAERAVQRCRRALLDAGELVAARGPRALGSGWALCHGAGGPAAVLALAADVLAEGEHRKVALDAAAAWVEAAGDAPEDWPCGLSGVDGDVSLLNGLAGTALVLADLALPGALPSPALLGMGGV